MLMEMEVDVGEYVKVAEAAKMLGIAKATVYDWLRQGKFPGTIKSNPDAKRGSAYKIPVSEVLAEMERQRKWRD